ncbi:phosphatase 2C-like domain-containing protein [Hyaloraphidium curvatum]|nr:phosphatase 2C-like domain-containing protein [Hyaloraphidium curvatum]
MTFVASRSVLLRTIAFKSIGPGTLLRGRTAGFCSASLLYAGRGSAPLRHSIVLPRGPSSPVWMSKSGTPNLQHRKPRPAGPEASSSAARTYSTRGGGRSSNTVIFLVATGLAVAGVAYYAFLRPSDAGPQPAQPTPEANMALDAINKRLREKESVHPVGGGSVVAKYEMNYIPSNNPFEDRHDEKRSLSGNRFYFGMYDGHGGWEAATLVQEYLTAYVAYEVEAAVGAKELPLDAKLTPEQHKQRKELIDKAITTAYERLDADLLNGSLVLPGTSDKASLADQMRASFAGACALMAFIDGKDLYVALAGDARAVLGRRAKWGWETVQLSQDQTPRNPEEYRRLLLEHPGEEFSVVVRGRVLGGLMPSRAFGDSRYKYSIDVMTKLLGTATSRNMPRNYLTPPYVTAKPVIVHHELDDRDSFMVLATDGLWDNLGNEEVVEMVADLLEKRKPTSLNQPGLYAKLDTNSATHLIRNSLGGSEQERVNWLLNLQAPISRQYRDDVTVTVVFFDREALGGRKPAEGPEGEMMVVDPKKGDPKTKKPRLATWLQMAESERAKARAKL